MKSLNVEVIPKKHDWKLSLIAAIIGSPLIIVFCHEAAAGKMRWILAAAYAVILSKLFWHAYRGFKTSCRPHVNDQCIET